MVLALTGENVVLRTADIGELEPYYGDTSQGPIELLVDADITEAGTTQFTATTKYPVRLEASHVTDQLWNMVFSLENASDQELVRLAMRGGFIDTFGSVRRYSDVLKGLGYDWSRTESTTGAVTTRIARLSYPSLEALNASAERLFPATPLHLSSSGDGLISPTERMARLADGEILVPAQHPAELWAHASHQLVGWLALSKDFAESLQIGIGEYIGRDRSEARLRPIHEVDERIAAFMRPARAILELLASKFEQGGYDIAHELLQEDVNFGPRRPRWRGLSSVLEHKWIDGTSRMDTEYIPSGALGRPDYDFFNKAAETIWQRMDEAERRAQN